MDSAHISLQPKAAFRLTKIIFTLGPASSDEAMLEKLIHAGVDVCRLNMAHADHEWTRTMIRRIRAMCERHRPAPLPS